MRRGQTLIATLIVLAIMLMLAVYLLGGRGGTTTIPGGGSGVASARNAALAEKCKNNLSQIRASVEIYKTTSDTPPAALSDTHLSTDMYQCPVGKEPYVYDTATGKVHCPHPGHEKF